VIFFRRMDFARQRLLQGVVPVVTFAITVPLAATGVGVWSLVIGPAAGNLAGVAVAVRASPYPLALRWDRATANRYLRFSAWVLAAAAATLVVLQGQVLAIDLHDGLRAVGFVTLAATFARYVDRADQVVTVTIYPAICAIRGRTTALAELFVRSNRATLLWTLPAAAGIVLFAPAVLERRAAARGRERRRRVLLERARAHAGGEPVIAEIERVLRPGGWGYISWTNWYSPWGGHDMSPYHYLGLRLGPGLYERRHGPPRNNRYGAGLWARHIGPTLRLVTAQAGLEIECVEPRYWPQLRFVCRIPGLRELVTWNCVIRVRRV
jgi:SAM-dependent methyltransferase